MATHYVLAAVSQLVNARAGRELAVEVEQNGHDGATLVGVAA